MSLSPTSGRALYFPLPGVYSALYPKMRKYFHLILQMGIKLSFLGDLVQTSHWLLPAPSLATMHNKGATKKNYSIAIIL